MSNKKKYPQELGLTTVPDSCEFDLNFFEKQAVGLLLSGKPFPGKDEALTPIIQRL